MQAIMKKLGSAVLAAMFALSVAGFTAMASSAAAPAYAASSEQAITVSVQDAVDDDGEDVSTTWTYASLKTAGLVDEASTLGFTYLKPSGDWYVVGARNFVEVEALIAASGMSEYWTPGATIMLKTTDFPNGYDKYLPTYEEVHRANYFYGDTGATGAAPLTGKVATPTVLAFDYSQVEIPDGSTASATLAASSFEQGTRFCCGLDDSTVNGTGDVNMGKRMPTDITEIVIIPA